MMQLLGESALGFYSAMARWTPHFDIFCKPGKTGFAGRKKRGRMGRNEEEKR